mgnify:CR=1 FL=1
MDLKSNKYMDFLSESILHPDVSGFEILELLDIRSQLASREPLLDDDERTRLESIDRQLSQNAESWAARISEVADLAEMRKRNHVLPSHWWWYLDEMSSSRKKAEAMT